MNASALIDRLAHGVEIIPPIVRAFTPEQAEWNPEPSAWSVLEIVCHLADEETDDFRKRVKRTLADPTDPWPPIDPEGWATQRRYCEQSLDGKLAKFIVERSTSIAWLHSLRDPDWNRTHHHPSIGPLRAGDLLAAWVDHDALHIRQLAKRLHQLTQRDAGEFETRYAGDW